MNDIHPTSVLFHIRFGCAQKLFCDMNEIYLVSVTFQIYFGCALARYYIAFNLLGLCCVTGMSYIFKKSVLDQLNGLGWYGRYLAEDFFLTKAMHEK